MQGTDFLKDIESTSAETRFAAWRRAGEADPSSIAKLGELATHSNPGIAKAAREAITTMVHAAGKDSSNPRRPLIVKELLALANGNSPVAVRAHALRHLSLIAAEDSVPAIAKLLANDSIQEEAIFCLERIPGVAADKALLAAYRPASERFKPRILAALGHRRIADATPLATEAMRSPNKDLAVAGVRALGRIGRKPTVKIPDIAGLSEWQQTDAMDSLLRYADAQVAAGNAPEAMRIYKTAMAKPEAHWQCAAMIGIAKIGTPDAAAAIFPLLKSSNRRVRLTARNVWRKMAETA